jgi:hypothetical protein
VQDFLGVTDAAAALERIYHDALLPRDNNTSLTEEDLRDLRPFVIVGTGDGFTLRVVGEGTRGTYGASGELYALFERNIVDFPVLEVMNIRSVCGDVMSALAGYAPGQPNAVDIRQIVCDRPILTDESQIAEVGDAIQCEIRVEWGRQ